MELSRHHFKQFLQTTECEELIEKIVSVYSTSLLKKIHRLEEQLQNFFAKSNQYQKTSSSCQSEYTDLTFRNRNGYRREDNNNLKKNEEKSTQTENDDYSETFSRLNSIYTSEDSSDEELIHNGTGDKSSELQNNIFGNDIHIENIELPKSEYSDNLVLGISTKNVKNNKVVFVSRGKRYWIHLDNCKPRTHREREVQTVLEKSLRSEYNF